MLDDSAHLGHHDVHDDVNPHDAVRFGRAAAGIGAALLIAGAVWMSTCVGATADSAACGVPQRILVTLAGPAVLLFAGLRAFARTYQSWKRHENWRAWQCAALTLMALTLLALTLALPMLAHAG
jgi:hypothetical protein